MTFIAVGVAAAATVAGAAISANAAGKAAKAGQQASSDATAAQERMFDRQIELQSPWRTAGEAGLNALLQYTGLTTPQQAKQQADKLVFDEAAYLAANPDVAAELNSGQARGYSSGQEHYNLWGRAEGRIEPMTPAGQVPGSAAATPQIDPAQFGSLLKGYEAPAFNFQADPGYQFRLEQGEQGLDRAARAAGVGQSGKFLKDAMRFNSGLASQEYGAAHGRYTADTTNEFNRFNINQGNVWNRLSGLAGLGQTATNTLTNAAGTLGQQQANNIYSGANAAAAGAIGQANAWNGAIGQGVSMYQQNRLLAQQPQIRYDTGAGMSPPNPWYVG